MRWARNSGLIGGAIGLVILAQSDAFTIWNVPVSSLFEPLFFVAILAALGFALGFWARWSLGRIAGQAVEKVPRAILSKWTIGATVLNALLVFADYSFEWRGPKFVSGTSAAAIAENGGYVIGALGSAALLGLFVGIVSCLGVKRAMRRDRERGGAAESSHWSFADRFRGAGWRRRTRGRKLAQSPRRADQTGGPLVERHCDELARRIPALGLLLGIQFPRLACHRRTRHRDCGGILVGVWIQSVQSVCRLRLGVGPQRIDHRLAACRHLAFIKPIRRRKRAAGRSGFWGGAAKVGVFLGAARLLLTLATSGAPQLTEAWKVAFLDDPDIPPYAIRIMRAGTEVEVAGGFKYGLHSDFERILKAAPQVKVVHLNSLGGRIGEAEKLYETIKTKGLVTYTSTHCISACTLAFAAGKSRWILRGAKLGYHAPTFPGWSREDIDAATLSQKKLLVAAGVEAAFAGRAMATPNADVWFPSEPELKAASVISGVASADDFAASGYGANVTRDVVVTKLKQAGTLYVALEQADPTTFSRIADKFYQRYVEGETEAKILEAVRGELLPLIQARRGYADDQTLLDLARLLVEQWDDPFAQGRQTL